MSQAVTLVLDCRGNALHPPLHPTPRLAALAQGIFGADVQCGATTAPALLDVDYNQFAAMQWANRQAGWQRNTRGEMVFNPRPDLQRAARQHIHYELYRLFYESGVQAEICQQIGLPENSYRCENSMQVRNKNRER